MISPEDIVPGILHSCDSIPSPLLHTLPSHTRTKERRSVSHLWHLRRKSQLPPNARASGACVIILRRDPFGGGNLLNCYLLFQQPMNDQIWPIPVVSSEHVMLCLQMGIVGLPNVGKSSLFNLLTEQAIAAENYPFCTIGEAHPHGSFPWLHTSKGSSRPCCPKKYLHTSQSHHNRNQIIPSSDHTIIIIMVYLRSKWRSLPRPWYPLWPPVHHVGPALQAPGIPTHCWYSRFGQGRCGRSGTWKCFPFAHCSCRWYLPWWVTNLSDMQLALCTQIKWCDLNGAS